MPRTFWRIAGGFKKKMEVKDLVKVWNNKTRRKKLIKEWIKWVKIKKKSIAKNREKGYNKVKFLRKRSRSLKRGKDQKNKVKIKSYPDYDFYRIGFKPVSTKLGSSGQNLYTKDELIHIFYMDNGKKMKSFIDRNISERDRFSIQFEFEFDDFIKQEIYIRLSGIMGEYSGKKRHEILKKYFWAIIQRGVNSATGSIEKASNMLGWIRYINFYIWKKVKKTKKVK